MPRPLRELFGLDPLLPAVRDAWRAIAGDPYRPPVRRGLSSLRIFKPSLSFPAWLGRRRGDRRVPVYNFFNRARDESERAYSVRVTTARDFRGGRWTYDGHLGTDFVVPVRTPVVAAAPGLVLAVASRFDQGGLKVCVDHGEGLLTTSNHLSRAAVRPGQRVARGQLLGHSGASGVEFVLFFPWLAPHLHFNTWLDGVPVDPFAEPGEVALWRAGNEPAPPPAAGGDRAAFRPTAWRASDLRRAVAACLDPAERARLDAVPEPGARAAEVLLLANYRPALFAERPRLYPTRHARRPVLDLPFSAADVSGVWLPA